VSQYGHVALAQWRLQDSHNLAAGESDGYSNTSKQWTPLLVESSI
jgi:hypothetical protein